MIWTGCCACNAHRYLQCLGAFQLSIHYKRFLSLLFRPTYCLDGCEREPYPSCFLVSASFHSKLDVIFCIKVICKCCLLWLLGESLHVSIILHPACHKEYPSYTSISDNSYQCNCFQILPAHLVGQETSSRKALQGWGTAAGLFLALVVLF